MSLNCKLVPVQYREHKYMAHSQTFSYPTQLSEIQTKCICLPSSRQNRVIRRWSSITSLKKQQANKNEKKNKTTTTTTTTTKNTEENVLTFLCMYVINFYINKWSILKYLSVWINTSMKQDYTDKFYEDRLIQRNNFPFSVPQCIK